MTKETKIRLLSNALDFEEVTYTKYRVYDGNDILDTYDTEEEAKAHLVELEEDLGEYDRYVYRIKPINYTITKKELIDIILNTI